MAPEDVTQQTPPSGDFEPNLDPNVNKTDATHQLIAEWTRAGKGTRSNVDLVDELTRRYPRAGFTTGIVAQAKQRLKSLAGGADQRTDGPTPSPELAVPANAGETETDETETEFVRQLRHLVHMIGREAVKKLIDSL